jgi:hypothetical protein
MRLAVPVTVPELAVIVAAPAPTPLTAPPEATVATVEDEELQLTDVVRFCRLPSLKIPVAVSCWVMPKAMVEVEGLTAMEERVAEVTVNGAVPVTEPAVAAIIVWPEATLEAVPLEPMAATAEREVAQLTDAVRFCVLPSEKVPVAANDWTAPIGIERFCGVTWIETRLGFTASAVDP